MRRPTLSFLFPALLACAPAAAHADRQGEIIAELKGEGYSSIEVGRTWLRRVRIVAQGPMGAREIVIDPRNDEILRDYQRPADLSADPVPGRGRADRPPPPGGPAFPGGGVPRGGDRPHPGRPDAPGPGGTGPERPPSGPANVR